LKEERGKKLTSCIYRDRRKLTFYFEAEYRIDFRELVRELFKTYKTRIWMCVVTPPISVKDIEALN
jgi:cell fate regulator YaaT (PSP1 superfamily)